MEKTILRKQLFSKAMEHLYKCHLISFWFSNDDISKTIGEMLKNETYV